MKTSHSTVNRLSADISCDVAKEPNGAWNTSSGRFSQRLHSPTSVQQLHKPSFTQREDTSSPGAAVNVLPQEGKEKHTVSFLYSVYRLPAPPSEVSSPETGIWQKGSR
ncbi:hypothetical protein FQA47_022540 [Oryzias melastigma]|uniref:Uncharacterized protein n=1 Tax=Oryzias melastigma TaxID=30732 RepID=A0A834FDJ0_ORYME|nr:hypothetical protein FQA47_022540 [Oryzias melastigma]